MTLILPRPGLTVRARFRVGPGGPVGPGHEPLESVRNRRDDPARQQQEEDDEYGAVSGVTMGDTDPHALIPRLVALHAEGKLPLEKLERTYGLDAIGEAADDMHSGATVKPVIVF